MISTSMLFVTGPPYWAVTPRTWEDPSSLGIRTWARTVGAAVSVPPLRTTKHVVPPFWKYPATARGR